jgi:hypothetical protein
MNIAIVLAACWLGGFLVGCADSRSKGYNSDSYRSEAYYSGKPDTVREAEEVDGRAGATSRRRPPAPQRVRWNESEHARAHFVRGTEWCEDSFVTPVFFVAV